MAKLIVKCHRYFRRKPVRFFTFIILYLTAGSLVFLHSGFVGETNVSEKESSTGETVSYRTDFHSLSFLQLGKGFKEPAVTQNLPRRYGSWLKEISRESPRWNKSGSSNRPWTRALKGRTIREQEENKAKYIGCYMDNTQQRALRGASFFDYKKMTVFRCQDNCAERGYLYAGLEFGAECYCGHKIQAINVSDSECTMECKGEKNNVCGGANRLSIYRLELTQESARRYGNAIFRGCFQRPENVSLALPVSAVMWNMSVERCVDFCTEKEFSLAVLAGTICHCGFPTTHFMLHEREDEQLCAQRCIGEEYESCGNTDYFIVYQTQVQDNRCMDRKFLPATSSQLIALASFPGAGNTWARHLIELATGYYSGSYYFDGSLYNKGFKGEKDNWKSRRTICIKTHESGKKEIEIFSAAILLIRNPYKALMAEFNRKYGGHIGFASQGHWKEWPEFVNNYAPWWVSHTLDWLKYGKKVLVVHFEDLKHDLFNQLKRMVQLFDFNISDDRLLCVESQKDGNFKRSGLRKLEYDPYTPEMRKMINSYIKTVDMALKLQNLTGVPDEYAPR
ncbi:WSC domain-containing protein 2 isoform X2 [Protopterus annectens]|uniref:WSC domain-containing protein 2 isoform X2 n=1 Tax=Protopterus annectens TaxID=7888 RepID=UPI001CFB381B|nr:WSC domain-containing protein 2 isoform X2 [Protopterus annectens]